MKAEKGEEAEEEKRRSVNAIADTTQYVHNAMLLKFKVSSNLSRFLSRCCLVCFHWSYRGCSWTLSVTLRKIKRPLDLHAYLTNVTCPNKPQTLIPKALVKRIRRKSTKLKASLRNWNLLTNFGSVAKRIRKSVGEFTQVAKSRNLFYLHANDLRWTCINLRWVAKW